METKLRAMPGVTDVGLISQLPLTGSGPLSPFAYDEATARNWESETSDGRNMSPGIFPGHGDAAARRAVLRRPRFRPRRTSSSSTKRWPPARGPARNAVGKRLQVQPTGTPTPSPR